MSHRGMEFAASQPTERHRNRRSAGRIGSLQTLRALPIRSRILLARRAQYHRGGDLRRRHLGRRAGSDAGAQRTAPDPRIRPPAWCCWRIEAERLQGLIHRYFTQPNADLLTEINDLREALLGTLKNRASNDPILSGSAPAIWCRRPNASSQASATCAMFNQRSPTPTSIRC